MSARHYYYYIPYIVIGFVITIPSLSVFESVFGVGTSDEWLWRPWATPCILVGFLGLWLAQRRGLFLPPRPVQLGPINILARLMAATVYARALFAVMQHGVGGLDLITILLMIVFGLAFLSSRYLDYKYLVAQKGEPGPT